MAFNKVALLILLGTFLLLSESEYADAAVCPRNCNPNIRYGRCPKSGNKKFKVGCTNCCAGIAGCNYFSANGTFLCEGQTKKPQVEETIETREETNKVCPRNCNPNIRYGRCPKSGNKKFKVGCTNCCSGTAGCNYFSANGTFLCEGQTKNTQVEETIETRDETNKVCPFNCNPRIAYSICPGNKRSKGRICTNCCAGRKGCNYYSADGTFVCEGESKVESY